MSDQPNLFESTGEPQTEKILLFALGEFQSRGKVLTDRSLALDRLRGAFKRAAEKFQAEELADESIARTLEKLGAHVVRRPSFVAKHPFSITIHSRLANEALEFYKTIISRKSEV